MNNAVINHLFIPLLLAAMTSCRAGAQRADTLALANLAALEQGINMENQRVETDDVLQFEQTLIELGEIPLGESREAEVAASNRTEKPLAVLDAYTSCSCTKVEWAKRPIQSGGQTSFKVRFTAEQPGVFFKKIAVRHSAESRPVTFAIQGVVLSAQNPT